MSFTPAGAALTAADASSASSVATTAQNVASGELLLAFFAWNDVSNNTLVGTVTDNAGNTWVAAGALARGGNTNSRLYYCLSSAANAALVATCTIVDAVNSPQSRDYRSAIISRFTIAGGTVSMDTVPTPATGTSTTPTSNSFSTTDRKSTRLNSSH